MFTYAIELPIICLTLVLVPQIETKLAQHGADQEEPLPAAQQHEDAHAKESGEGSCVKRIVNNAKANSNTIHPFIGDIGSVNEWDYMIGGLNEYKQEFGHLNIPSPNAKAKASADWYVLCCW